MKKSPKIGAKPSERLAQRTFQSRNNSHQKLTNPSSSKFKHKFQKSQNPKASQPPSSLHKPSYYQRKLREANQEIPKAENPYPKHKLYTYNSSQNSTSAAKVISFRNNFQHSDDIWKIRESPYE